MQPNRNPACLPLIYESPQYIKAIRPMLVEITKSDSSINTIKILKKLHESCYLLSRNQYYFMHVDREEHRRRYYAPSFKCLYQGYQDKLVVLFGQLAHIVIYYQQFALNVGKQNQPKLNRVLNFPLLQSSIPSTLTLSKAQCLLLFSMMSLGVTSMYSERANYPHVTDFGLIFSEEMYKTVTIVQYLLQELSDTKQEQNLGAFIEAKVGVLQIGRVMEGRGVKDLMSQYEQSKMCPIHIAHNHASIEDYFGCLKVDFANMYIGGGSLMSGLVQQEIMFANHPEMYISVLFCQRMSDNEAIYFAGFRKYWSNQGYAGSTKFSGAEIHQYQRDSKNRAKQYIIAIDALHFPRKNSKIQFQIQKINRELLKAYTGYSVNLQKSCNTISTGNWGCGAFNGNIGVKFLIQWIACSMANKQMIYCPFNRAQIGENKQLFQVIQKLSIKNCYNLLIKCCKKCQNGQEDILKMIKAELAK